MTVSHCARSCESAAHVRMYGKTEDPYARPGARPLIVDHALEDLARGTAAAR